MNVCVHCGMPLTAEVRLCGACGTAVSAVAPPATVTPPGDIIVSGDPAVPALAGDGRRRVLRWVAGGAAAVLAVVATTAVVLWLRYSPQDPASCVIGSWREESNTTTTTSTNGTTVLAVTGARQQYSADGINTLDYSGDVRQVSRNGSKTTEFHPHGRISYRYRIAGTEATYTDGSADGTYTVVGESAAKDLKDFVNDEPGFAVRETLTCSRARLTQHGERTDRDGRTSWTVILARV